MVIISGHPGKQQLLPTSGHPLLLDTWNSSWSLLAPFQTLHVGALTALARLMETLLEEEDGGLAASTWFQDVFQVGLHSTLAAPS